MITAFMKNMLKYLPLFLLACESPQEAKEELNEEKGSYQVADKPVSSFERNGCKMDLYLGRFPGHHNDRIFLVKCGETKSVTTAQTELVPVMMGDTIMYVEKINSNITVDLNAGVMPSP